jgi:hypothetical protein
VNPLPAGYQFSTARILRVVGRESLAMLFLLWILAVILVIAGIFQLFKGQMLWGIVLIIIGFAVGPGGYSIFK